MKGLVTSEKGGAEAKNRGGLGVTRQTERQGALVFPISHYCCARRSVAVSSSPM